MHVRTCNFTIFILKKSTLWSPFETPIYSKIGCHLWTFPEVKFGASFILFYISSEFQRQSFVFQSHENSTKNGLIAEEDLHIYLIDSENLTNSKMILEVMMRNRSRKNKEFWFIDISAFQTITNAELMLNSLPLDIDDDIFLYTIMKNDTARIWEIYKLLPGKDLIVRDVGGWTKDFGLNLTTKEKWQRRSNLLVRIYLRFIFDKKFEAFLSLRDIISRLQVCHQNLTLLKCCPLVLVLMEL